MNKIEIEEIGKYLNDKYVIARDVDKIDRLNKQDMYIQKLYDNYLDLKIKYSKIENYVYGEHCQNDFDIIEIKKIMEQDN